MKDENQVEDSIVKSLREAIEQMHGCKASWIKAVSVKEIFNEQPVWEGTVHVFDLKGHSKAKRAYAWSSPVPDSPKHRSFAVLHLQPVTSPIEAVRAAIVEEYRETQKPKK